MVHEVRRPVGVIGANYEARPNVTVDVASQLVKSRNAGVLRTGAAALASALALHEHVIVPALADGGVEPGAVQVLSSPDRDAARALVSQPGLIPLVILRGSGGTTATLAREAAAHGVRTLAHADGGGVLFVHRDADPALTRDLVAGSLDRLGVCNRLNLLLVDAARWDEWAPGLAAQLEGLGIRPSLPPHDHPLGHEWALDDGSEATVTLAPARVARRRGGDRRTPRRQASRPASSPPIAAAAGEFLAAYRGTGAFWNATTRLLDGFKLLGRPGDRHQRGPCPGTPRSRDVPRPAPAPVRGGAGGHRPSCHLRRGASRPMPRSRETTSWRSSSPTSRPPGAPRCARSPAAG